MTAVMALTVREHTALTVEAARYKHGGARITAIRRECGWSEVRQAQVVSALLDRPDAEAELPATVRRLRALRDRRRAVRSEADRWPRGM